MKANLGSELEYDVWIDTQVELLKTGRLRELDVANLIEELEDLGRSEKAACRSFVYQIILHKLLCNHWTEEQKRNLGHWTAEIIAFQFQLNDRLTTNIRNHLEDELENIYQKAAKAVEAKITIIQKLVLVILLILLKALIILFLTYVPTI